MKLITPLNDEWSFCGENLTKEQAEQNENWETVHIPHTWNNLDGQDGGNDYRRGKGWYKYILNIEKSPDCEFYIEFLGVNSVSDVYVNGRFMGQHRGGYTLFRYNITDALIDGKNTLLVCADNSPFPDVNPLEADFTFFGGIYREVNLITVSKTHFDLDDFGSEGIKLSYENSPAIRDCAALEVSAKTAGADSNCRVHIAVSIPSEFDACPGIDRTDFAVDSVISEKGETVAEKEAAVVGNEVKCVLGINRPHLWNGRKDPFRYKVVCTLYKGDEAVDRVEKYIGFRYFSIRPRKGFLLNGESYPLRGVNRHQDRKDMGNAITYKEHDEDFAMIYEIGANAIRLAHYPHHPRFYEQCDRYGLLVWAEIPFVNQIGGLKESGLPTDTVIDPDVTARQLENAELQMRELISQQCHRPSIFCWSMSNEVMRKYGKTAAEMMKELDDLIHELDSTRYSAMAVNHTYAFRWKSDIKGCNTYPGWYWGTVNQFGHMVNYFAGRNFYRGLAVSEYGAGSNTEHHCDNPSQPKDTVCDFHPEEWQSIVHEHALKYFMAPRNKWIWGTFVWNMFDFAVDIRKEGSMPGMNNKGLVTYDRKIRKDAFYLYKSYWSAEPTLRITSSRFTVRKTKKVCVKIYSNADCVTLTVNGKKFGAVKADKCKQPHIFLFPDVTLNDGLNGISAEGSNGANDTVTWEYKK